MTEPDASKDVPYTDDEISLVDLLAVMLRRRRIIIAVPLVVTLLAGIYLYLLPLAGISTKKNEYVAQLSASVSSLPNEIQILVPVNIAQTLDSYFSSIPVQTVLYTKYFPEITRKLSQEELATFIKNQFLQKRFKYAYDDKIKTYTISLQSPDRKQADLYLSEIWSGAVALLKDRINERIAASLVVMEQQISMYSGIGASSDVSSRVILTADSLQKKALLALKDNLHFPFDSDPVHLVFSDGRSEPSKTLILAFIASLFVGILLAFMANAWANIRHDPEAMEKLRSAWKA